jgi:polyhydroxyalkanoate synthesis regulator protein
MRQKLVIKYKNRKLYDSDNHHYVTLAHLVEYVKRGVAFKVIEHTTHKDVTSAALREALIHVEIPTATLMTILRDNKEMY